MTGLVGLPASKQKCPTLLSVPLGLLALLAPATHNKANRSPEKPEKTFVVPKKEIAMTFSTVSEERQHRLPTALRTAQAAIHLPEVQEMLRRLAEHNLGIFMPHMHDGETGDFQPLPDDVAQVEGGLEVWFVPTPSVALHAERFLPVGWCWRAGASSTAAACEMVWEDRQVEAQSGARHKSLQGN